MADLQQTIASTVTFSGHGVHSALPSVLKVSPAPANTGVVFIYKGVEVQANYKNVSVSNLCTTLCSSGLDQISIRTVEHVMAAIVGLSIDNLFIEVSAPEVPILDGSALLYVDSFAKVGLVKQEPRSYFVVKQKSRVESEYGFAEFLPYDGTVFDVTIDFPGTIIGRQQMIYDMAKDDFSIEIASARTFGFAKDIEMLWASGLALGSCLENSVVIDTQGSIANASGLRYENEFVRHKLLDAVGDTALIGHRFKGIFHSFCSGHSLNFKAVEKLMEMSKIA
ncbi:UDP-3-O-acyl-N-acetylglucosamine deacetylase [Bartonella sp. TP]|uniref:UDP-3-O-acyl-N-acetylglucosamine deacetylase n=1 Tax=Bartonella sp. TP TaxID=3057550 RepID=UPI0025B01A62|nr:UDP-3-O-acyl-N-acetylglucosamine deacetylase [Bartonella sp. TP]WJW79770.1 UDP-3-O-acyl-N-acetylglucosamine deacetylase [Bartonella sp. TP]